MPYQPILATLAYVMSADRLQVLMVHRNRQPGHLHEGKYNGVGGKLEPGENVVEGLRREIREEVGIDCDRFVLRGTVNWPGFGKQGEDWFGFIFRVDAWHGEPWSNNAEGDLLWIPKDQLLSLPLWEGDRYFLPLVFDETIQQFHGVMPYAQGRPTDWDVHLLY